MQTSNGGEFGGMFDNDDDDLYSAFDHFDGGSGINGDDLLEALSTHDDNLFDDIDVDNDANIMSAPPQAAPQQPSHQRCGDPGINNNINNNNAFLSFNAVPTIVPVAVNTFRRRASLNDEQSRPSFSNRRRTNKKKSSRKNISSNEPLFADGVRGQNDPNIFDEDDYSESDVASACSAPADLEALCGLYDYPTDSPDVLNVQSMFLNPNTSKQQKQLLHPSANSIDGMREMMFSVPTGGEQDEEMIFVRQRQQELLQEERKRQEASASQKPPPRRRKSYDGAVSLPMLDEFRLNMMQGGGGGAAAASSVNPIYGETNMNAMSGNNILFKRRKSEPAMLDLLEEEMNGGNNRGGSNLYSATSMDHMLGFSSTSYPSASIPASNSNMDKSALDVAVEEAHEKINHLKQLLYMSKNRGGGGGCDSFDSGQVQQQQLQQQQQQPSWWSSLSSELGGTGLNLEQSDLGGHAQDLSIPIKSPKKPKKKTKQKPIKPAAPAQIPLPNMPDPEILKLDPTKLMEKLQESMTRTSSSMKQLQDWDRANGLPKSHSQTMVNSNKSRKKLADKAGPTPFSEQLVSLGSKDETQKDGEIKREKFSAMHAL